MAERLVKRGDYLRAVFDAFPSPVFIMDTDMAVLDSNLAASAMFGGGRRVTLRRLSGEVLHCIHARNAKEGCGTSSFCPDCVIREAVKEAKKRKKVYRRRHEMRLSEGDETRKATFLVTASPIAYKDRRLVLLILEDVTELTQLRKIIPICAKCKRIRDDKAYWEDVESYFARHSELRFSHGLCPECVKELYPDLEF